MTQRFDASESLLSLKELMPARRTDSGHAFVSRVVPHASRTGADPSKLASIARRDALVFYRAGELEQVFLIQAQTAGCTDSQARSGLEFAQQLQIVHAQFETR